MGVLDMMNLFIFCMADGVLGMLGAVYCSAPDFMYVKGGAMMSKLLLVITNYTSIRAHIKVDNMEIGNKSQKCWNNPAGFLKGTLVKSHSHADY